MQWVEVRLLTRGRVARVDPARLARIGSHGDTYSHARGEITERGPLTANGDFRELGDLQCLGSALP